MALHLALLKGLLVSNKLLFRPTLLSLLNVRGGLELALLKFCAVIRLLSLLLYFSDALLLPCRESLRIFASALLGLNPFLVSKK